MTTPAATQLPSSPKLSILAECPLCRFGTDVDLPDGTQTPEGFRLACESCGFDFLIKAPEVQDLQHAALVLLGEA